MKLETREFENGKVKQLILGAENEHESSKIDHITEGKVPVSVRGEVVLSDGYGEHYIRLIKAEPSNIQTLNELAKYIDNWAERKGWNQNLVLGNQFINFVTEIAEAWENLRDGRSIQEIYYTETSEGPKPEGVGIELADLFIRVLHTAGHYGVDIEECLRIKMAYNEKRPFRHGGKQA